MTIFEERAKTNAETLANLENALKKHLGTDADRILREDTCVYVVGSGGRGEMSAHSDVDLFVARVGREPSAVDAFQIREAIARAQFELALPDPSKDGEFLKMHTAKSLCERMGTPEDDAANTFTARMLLLLESRALLGSKAYGALLSGVVDGYWKNATDHTTDYQPFVLVNDIVRYWRILLLNYVAKNAEKERELHESERDAERRHRSYKLRFSRCITCFSTLAALLSETAADGITKAKVVAIAGKTPVERLLSVRTAVNAEHVDLLLELYAKFLKNTSADKKQLHASFADEHFRKERAAEGREFGDAMFDLLQHLGSAGRGRELFRYMVV